MSEPLLLAYAISIRLSCARQKKKFGLFRKGMFSIMLLRGLYYVHGKDSASCITLSKGAQSWHLNAFGVS